MLAFVGAHQPVGVLYHHFGACFGEPSAKGGERAAGEPPKGGENRHLFFVEGFGPTDPYALRKLRASGPKRVGNALWWRLSPSPRWSIVGQLALT